MDKWSNKYWWWIAAQRDQPDSGYFYAPYIPVMKEGIVKMDSSCV